VEHDESEPVPSGGRRLGDGAGAPQTSGGASSSSRSRQPPARGLRTLQDLQGDGASHSHGHDDDDDDEDNPDLFAGGEKSALAVQNPATPQDHFQGLLDRARRYAAAYSCFRRPG